MEARALIVTDRSDLAESRLIIGMAEAGLPLTLLANDTGKNYSAFIDGGVDVRPLQLKGRFDRGGTAVIREVLKAASYTVIYAFNPRALACALRASKGFDVKVMAYRGVIGNLGLLKPESWTTFLHPRLDRVVCVSKAVQRYVESVGKLPFTGNSRKAVTIYKGHDLSWYDTPPASLSAFQFPENAFVVSCIGRDRPGKGFSTLIEAMDLVPDSCQLHLLLVGDLEKNAELVAQVKACRHSERIRFSGYRTDAPQVAGATHALVLPSESEGLPRVVIEAMAYRRPVVVTQAGGMPELVTNGVEGYVVPTRDPKALADALVRLSSNVDQAKRMGERGRMRIEMDFSLEMTVSNTIQLIRELTNELI
ncbi:glycosyltransferase family 4 protein [Marinobacter litoralis]|uniref:glycosyltransferase family 4 protein n=1 Tax=Marinobacter litoralis TaxID=187981 RepID=UPI0018EC4BF8|nr:glycosyltransferase family 4 protein [Marinobacter litoralis]MBJ6138729.1 glycosyltransferase family 4 protein [Marinobacter litoralis]